MAIRGSSDNQIQQMSDIIAGLESVRQSVSGVYSVQKQLLSELSANSESSNKTLGSIKDTMERQVGAMAKHMESLSSSAVRQASDSQVSATSKLMSESSVKPNSAADAEIRSMTAVIKEHTKQLMEASKNSTVDEHAMEKLISGLEHMSMSQSAVKKLVDDIRSGKIDGTKTFVKRSGMEMSPSEIKAIAPAIATMLKSNREIGILKDQSYDDKEKNEDLDKLQEKSDEAILQIRDALVKSLNKKTPVKSAKYQSEAEASKSSIGGGSGGGGGLDIDIGLPLPGKGLFRKFGKLFKGNIGGILGGLYSGYTIYNTYKEEKERGKLMDEARARLGHREVMRRIEAAPDSFAKDKARTSEVLANNGTSDAARAGATLFTHGAEERAWGTAGWLGNAAGDLLGIESMQAGGKWSAIDKGGNLRYVKNPYAKAALGAGGNAMLLSGLNAVQNSSLAHGLLTKAPRAVGWATRSARMAKWTSKALRGSLKGGMGTTGMMGAASTLGLSLLAYYSLKTGQEAVENMDVMAGLSDSVAKDQREMIQKNSHWRKSESKEDQAKIAEYLAAKGSGKEGSQEGELAYVKWKLKRQFLAAAVHLYDKYSNEFNCGGWGITGDLGLFGAFTANQTKQNKLWNDITDIHRRLSKNLKNAKTEDEALQQYQLALRQMVNICKKAFDDRATFSSTYYSNDEWQKIASETMKVGNFGANGINNRTASEAKSKAASSRLFEAASKAGALRRKGDSFVFDRNSIVRGDNGEMFFKKEDGTLVPFSAVGANATDVNISARTGYDTSVLHANSNSVEAKKFAELQAALEAQQRAQQAQQIITNNVTNYTNPIARVVDVGHPNAPDPRTFKCWRQQ